MTSTKEKICQDEEKEALGTGVLRLQLRQGVKKGQSPGSEVVNHRFFMRK